MTSALFTLGRYDAVLGTPGLAPRAAEVPRLTRALPHPNPKPNPNPNPKPSPNPGPKPKPNPNAGPQPQP